MLFGLSDSEWISRGFAFNASIVVSQILCVETSISTTRLQLSGVLASARPHPPSFLDHPNHMVSPFLELLRLDRGEGHVDISISPSNNSQKYQFQAGERNQGVEGSFRLLPIWYDSASPFHFGTKILDLGSSHNCKWSLNRD